MLLPIAGVERHAFSMFVPSQIPGGTGALSSFRDPIRPGRHPFYSFAPPALSWIPIRSSDRPLSLKSSSAYLTQPLTILMMAAAAQRGGRDARGGAGRGGGAMGTSGQGPGQRGRGGTGSRGASRGAQKRGAPAAGRGAGPGSTAAGTADSRGPAWSKKMEGFNHNTMEPGVRLPLTMA